MWHNREIDFWNLAGGTGRVLHQRVVRTFQNAEGVGFECDLIHRATNDPVVDILREADGLLANSAARYAPGGVYGSLFDAAEDTFVPGKLTAWDISAWMSDPAARVPLTS